MEKRNSSTGVYGITVAAELSGLGEQTLRLYERRGLLLPARTAGGTRRYSDDDVARIIRVTELVSEGVNLVGARRIIELEILAAQLAVRVRELEADSDS